MNGQRKKLSCNVVATEASADSVEVQKLGWTFRVVPN